MSELNEDEQVNLYKINLGGFPPIIKVNNIVKKKRGRKPKNHHLNLVLPESVPLLNNEKKKRGRKKKYEIENFEKILNRNLINNFNHNIVYSDNETEEEDSNTKNILFGNLNIHVNNHIFYFHNQN